MLEHQETMEMMQLQQWAILRMYFINIKLVRAKAMLTLYVIPCT